MHPNDFIIQLIIAAGSGEKGVSVSDEHVEQVHNLYKEVKRSYNRNIYTKSTLQQKQYNDQNLQRNNSQLHHAVLHYFVALSIIFLIVQKRQTRSLSTIVSGARKIGFYYFVYKGPQNKKKHY